MNFAVENSFPINNKQIDFLAALALGKRVRYFNFSGIDGWYIVNNQNAPTLKIGSDFSPSTKQKDFSRLDTTSVSVRKEGTNYIAESEVGDTTLLAEGSTENEATLKCFIMSKLHGKEWNLPDAI